MIILLGMIAIIHISTTYFAANADDNIENGASDDVADKKMLMRLHNVVDNEDVDDDIDVDDVDNDGDDGDCC